MSPTNSELICLMVYKWYLLATTISCAVRACAFVSGEPDLKKLSEDFELAIQICNPDFSPIFPLLLVKGPETLALMCFKSGFKIELFRHVFLFFEV